MGMMVQGVWRDIPRDFKSTGGAFVRPDTAFRESVSLADAEPGRYRLYVSRACPWAHRTLIMRAFARLEKVVPVFNADPYMAENGWEFDEGSAGIRYLHQLYAKAKPDYTGRVSVPALWDEKTQRIVNNESSEIIRMMGSDLYPVKLRKEIDAVNERVYQHGQQRRVPRGLLHRAGQVRSGGDRAVRHARLAGEAAGEAALAVRREAHRGRRAPFHHAGTLRRRLLLALQMQPAAAGGLSETMALHEKVLRAAGSGAHGRSRRDQVALLPQPEAGQSDADRTQGTGARLALALALALAAGAGAVAAQSDPYVDTLAPGGAAVGYTWREQSSPYRGAHTPRSFDPLYLYEGDYAYLHGTRAGLKAGASAWRFDAFVAQRFDGYNADRIPYGLEGQPVREPGFDVGVSARLRTAWGSPYVELRHDASHRSEGSEARLGVSGNGWRRGNLRGAAARRAHLPQRDASTTTTTTLAPAPTSSSA